MIFKNRSAGRRGRLVCGKSQVTAHGDDSLHGIGGSKLPTPNEEMGRQPAYSVVCHVVTCGFRTMRPRRVPCDHHAASGIMAVLPDPSIQQSNRVVCLGIITRLSALLIHGHVLVLRVSFVFVAVWRSWHCPDELRESRVVCRAS